MFLVLQFESRTNDLAGKDSVIWQSAVGWLDYLMQNGSLVHEILDPLNLLEGKHLGVGLLVKHERCSDIADLYLAEVEVQFVKLLSFFIPRNIGHWI